VELALSAKLGEAVPEAAVGVRTCCWVAGHDRRPGSRHPPCWGDGAEPPGGRTGWVRGGARCWLAVGCCGGGRGWLGGGRWSNSVLWCVVRAVRVAEAPGVGLRATVHHDTASLGGDLAGGIWRRGGWRLAVDLWHLLHVLRLVLRPLWP
jgi:hypothetical protein